MILKDSRLTLIPVCSDDIDDIFANFTSEVTTYMYPSPAQMRSDTQTVVENFMHQHYMQTDTVWCIRNLETQSFIGLVGLHNLKKSSPEIGIWTATDTHGNHYGRDAVILVLEKAKSLNYRSVLYPVDARNTASRKIPLFFKAEQFGDTQQIETQDHRTLHIETYRILL